MLENPNTMPEFKMSHKKHSHGMKNDKQSKMGMVQPMAHPKGAQHLKSVKKGHKNVSGK
jgi:hypothetical protein